MKRSSKYVYYIRSTHPEVILGKGVLKICREFIVALQLYWNRISSWVFSCNFAAYFQNTFFFYQGYLSRILTTHRTAREGRGPFLFHSTTSTRSRTSRDLFATLHMRWLSHAFNRTACIWSPNPNCLENVQVSDTDSWHDVDRRGVE